MFDKQDVSAIVPDGLGAYSLPDFFHREPPNTLKGWQRCRNTKACLDHLRKTCGRQAE